MSEISLIRTGGVAATATPDRTARAIRSLSAPRIAAVSSCWPPGFIITYDTRLIRSSPKRICGFINPAEASTSPLARSQRWPATVVEPTSMATPYSSSKKPGHTPVIDAVVVHGDGDVAALVGERRLQADERVRA